MTAINSNRAIRGPVTAVPVVAGKGVRLTADTANNRWVVEADETVLFTGDDTTVSLSEAYTNFERIRVVFKTNDNCIYETVFHSSQTGSSITINTSICNTTQMQYKVARYSVAATSLTFHSSWVYAFSDTGFTRSSTNATSIVEVVGINRIASN